MKSKTLITALFAAVVSMTALVTKALTVGDKELITQTSPSESSYAELFKVCHKFHKGTGDQVLDRRVFDSCLMVKDSRDYIDGGVYLGQMTMNGIGTTKNVNQGLKYLWAAATKGSALANYHYGIIYCEGKEVRADLNYCFKLLNLAASKKFLPATEAINKFFPGNK